MKKIIAISFLLTLSFSQVGYHFIYIIQQYQAKEAAEKQLLSTLPESSFEVIDATADSGKIEWEEAGKEFTMDGQMYDVAKVKTADGKTMLYCLNDKKEAQVLQDLSKAVKAGSEQNATGKDGKHTIKFNLIDLFPVLDLNNNLYQPVSQKRVDHTNSIMFNTIEVITPPPKLNYNA